MLKVVEKLAPIVRLSDGNLYKKTPEREAKKREDAVRVLEHIPATEATPAVAAKPAKGDNPAVPAQPAKPAKPADVKVVWYLPIVAGDGKLFERQSKLEAAVLEYLNAKTADAYDSLATLFIKTENGFKAPDGN